MPGVLCPHTTFLPSCHPLPNPRPCITQIPFTRSSAPAGGCLGQPDRPDALGRGLLDNSLASAEENTKEQEAGFLGELGQLSSYRAQKQNMSPNTKKWFSRCLQESGILVFKTPTPMLPYSFPPHLHTRVLQDAGCKR